ncbi:transposase [Cohnella fermenti]|nr:transposase [Cohnella fermenti]
MVESYESFLLAQGGEEACLDFFLRCRWPDGFRCPDCGCREAYTISTRRLPLFECARCHLQTSVTSGTVLEGTRTLLSKWLYAMRRVGDPSVGINAVQLSKLVRVTYKTAYAMLNKIRQCLSAWQTDKLAGRIEAGLALWGRELCGSFDLAPTQQPLAVGLACDDSDHSEKLVIMEIPRERMNERWMDPLDVDLFKELHFASDPISQGNPVHCSRFLTKRKCPTLASVIKAGFKRINDSYHGVHPRHLFKYLAEFTFRYNSTRDGCNALLHIVHACSSRSAA